MLRYFSLKPYQLESLETGPNEPSEVIWFSFIHSSVVIQALKSRALLAFVMRLHLYAWLKSSS